MKSRLAQVNNSELNHLIILALCAGILLFTAGEAGAKSTSHALRSNTQSKNLVAKSNKKNHRHHLASKPVAQAVEYFTDQGAQPATPGVYHFVFSSGMMTVTDLTTTGAQQSSH